jgi:hypothetical protein
MTRALIGALMLCAGCGSTTTRMVTVTRTVMAPAPAPSAPPRCVLISGLSNYGYDVCDGATIRHAGKRLDIPRPSTLTTGHWAGGFVSRDAKMLLLQWIAECEVPYAYFVSVRGGVPRLVTGERSTADAPESIADGWTSDGRAIVELPRGACGEGVSVPGIYLIAPSGQRTLVQRLPAHA